MSDIIDPCFRCGKQRVVVKTKKERVNGSLIITTTTCCPDPECQKLLDKKLKNDRDARDRLTSMSGNKTNTFGRQRKGIVLGKKAVVSRG